MVSLMKVIVGSILGLEKDFKLVSCQWLGILLLTPESFLGAGPAPLPSDSCALIISNSNYNMGIVGGWNNIR